MPPRELADELLPEPPFLTNGLQIRKAVDLLETGHAPDVYTVSERAVLLDALAGAGPTLANRLLRRPLTLAEAQAVLDWVRTQERQAREREARGAALAGEVYQAARRRAAWEKHVYTLLKTYRKA